MSKPQPEHRPNRNSPPFTERDKRLCTPFEAIAAAVLNILVFGFLMAGRKFAVVALMFWPAVAGIAALLLASVFVARHYRNS